MNVIEVAERSNRLFRAGVRYAERAGVTPLTLWREVEFLRRAVSEAIRDGSEPRARAAARRLATMGTAMLGHE